MAKQAFKVSDWELKHFMRTEQYASRITAIYEAVGREVIRLGKSLKVDPEKLFSFDDYPVIREQVKKLLADMAERIEAVTLEGTQAEWELANLKNDALVASVLDTTKIPAKLLARYEAQNLSALATFQKRKVSGMNLSSRVWNYTQQFKEEMELALDIGIGEGRSANELSRDVREYLNEPDKLFRRVRNKRGQLVLSKAARAYHPGQGVYRSSYKNAQRMTRTEINMAYRASDYERWNQLDFVVGVEVRRSNRPYVCDICEPLKGMYPKNFKFVGWHPNCRCYAVSVLATPAEMQRLTQMILDGEDTSDFRSENAVTQMPKGFTNWIEENRKRLLTSKSQPYFVRDNFKGGDIRNGLRMV
ncbi:hypothetical protein [Siphonobacter curvatus]|uniref:Phage head morphogenesis domain-containing protein n=1 Tax=Siphonobacter curvatus TaxID=2094562 RepID=A0A2S7IR37_9BACT|nr:hypothetical protein [Siphonobacter curvatus]PQA60177.1 hypothetical protein C5O19_11320 [Siphonobacter curvatus]